MHLSIEIGKIDRSFSEMRLTRPEQIAWMQNSLKAVGQLRPVVVRKEKGVYQMLDGFKRYYACQALKWEELQAHLVEVDNVTAKAMILSYNQQGSPLLDYEEAQIVYSLKKEHLMKQEEITLLSKSFPWVSRRLSFIERLEESVRTHLQLGKITPTHARELVKLPRGKQNVFLKLIIDNNLTSRQTSLLITKYLQSKTKEEETYILKNPVEAVLQQCMEEEINDCRLSLHGNRLLKTIRILARQQHIFIGQTTNPPLNELTDIELGILAEGFTDIVRKTKTIRSILKKYDNHER
ncbi:MAG: hypothetical protein DRI87_06530 [Bacteroidetes bacterium]|nr:MAG: hypothetical protein DRI87_06530 [Bacteroidota bacterium]